ncbi:uncharacterized protein [Fopius arisanus]|uniref:Uncharacterized protein n=1 Tax=Fopius arisanus TaxID=64838 RepID=A0A0C9QAV4_9HYME|nr:PREDICTED: uncharacterized protein LOC105267114 [Fopius arisanus]
MSDLIDLNSPEEKRLRPELPLPLIPSPENESPKPSGLNISDSRRSLDNNPFDMVLRKTSEYVSKSSDPFEIVFERATSKEPPESVKIPKSPKDSVPSRSEGNPSVEKNEVPAILVEPPSPGRNLSILDQSAMNDSLRTFSDGLSMSKNFSGLIGSSGPLDKSILDNSAMNDTLSTSEGSSDDCFIKSLIAQRVSMCIKKGTLDAELLDSDKSSKNPRMRRSFSQGDRLSPRKVRTKRSTSIINDYNQSQNSIPSILFEDPLNLAFMSRERDYSIVSDCSELSNITRLNSVNSGSLYSWKSTSDSANRGFIDSSGSDRKSQGSESNFSDLISRFRNLRMKSSGEQVVKEIPEGIGEEDSVFLEDEGARKNSIFSQANILARTFEELAEKSTRGSSSSGENLLSTRLPSNFEFSPEPTTRNSTVSDSSASAKDNSGSKTTSNISFNASKTPPDTSKKEAAVNLLRDLENVIKTEENPEVMKLLKDLEEALGAKSQNNSESSNKPHQLSTNESTSPSKIPISSCTSSKIPSSRVIKSPEKNPDLPQNSPGNSPNTLEKIEKQENPHQNLENEQMNETPGGGVSLEDSGDTNKTHSTNQESEKSTEDNTSTISNPSLEDPDNVNVNFSISKSTSKQIPSGRESTQDNFVTQKLILDIQLALGKLLEGCKEEPALVLENLNKVLTPNHSEKAHNSPRKSGLPNRSLKSSGHYISEQKIFQKTSKPFPLRRRSSISQKQEKSRNSELKDPDSPKKFAKRRNSSDPGIEVAVEKKRIDHSLNLKIKSTLPVGDKAKLKKKNDVEKKRGPMKALVPLGSMQRPGVAAPPGTPPKKQKVPSPLKIATSTPDPSPIVLGKKTTKAKPVASSTPDVGSKDRSSRSQIPQSPKKIMSWNISPVTPNAKGNTSNMFTETGTPQTPRTIEKSGKSRSPVSAGLRVKNKIIHGRRSVPAQGSPRAEGRPRAPPSPLKENNVIKVKPLNLNSKFRRRSESLGNIEKENKFLTHKA